MAHRLVSLVAEKVRFFSSLDEDNFFSWLKRIDAVTKMDGIGDRIVITCDPAAMKDESLREVIGLFVRYGIDTGQLDVFATGDNRSRFCDANAYWRLHRRPSSHDQASATGSGLTELYLLNEVAPGQDPTTPGAIYVFPSGAMRETG